jgi:hypothetical protein
MIKRTSLGMAIACLALQATTPAFAADDGKCCGRITPYYWAVGIDGSIEDNRGATTTEYDFSNDIGDVSDNLDFNGSLMLEFNKDHWANYAQVDFLKVNNDDTDRITVGGQTYSPDLQTDTTLASAATGYRWMMGERSHIDLMIGVRYAKLDVKAETRNFEAEGDADLVDGIFMMRPRFAIGKHWAFSPTWAIGGGDSDMTYELAPEFVYTNDCCNLEMRFGYRTVAYEYEEDNVELDFSYSGPMIGLGFAF